MSNVWQQLSDAMFPNVTVTPEQLEEQYPPRALKEGARVTRIAPSPTGYLHLGVFFTAMINRLTASATDGLFYFRLEDTDKKREVEGGADDILRGFNTYGLKLDEGFVAPNTVVGDYAPYQQSARVDIYHVYVKSLVEQGLAYPCFCSEEERLQARETLGAQKCRTGYYGPFAKCRALTADEAIARIQNGDPYVVRLRSPGDESRRIAFDDMIKGKIEMPENDEDIVLLKSDSVPTYHFAHAVDDHLMRTTHVIRGDEWISSVPKHLQLFRVLGFKAPKYAHVSPIMKEDNGGKRKLSKRKDPEAAMHFYAEQGYPADSVLEYLLTIANSDFEDWRRANPDAPRAKFPFNLKKMSVSGALFDMNKLNDVSKNVIAAMDAKTVTAAILAWAKEYDDAFYQKLAADEAFAEGIFAIDRGGAKPRKDMAKWSDAPDYAAYFFDDGFDGSWELPENLRPDDAVAVLKAYKDAYDPAADKQAWFDGLKALCPSLGFCPEVKEYKKNPDAYKGHVGDVSTIVRLAITGRRNTPDLCAIMQLLGLERVNGRLDAAIAKLSV